MHQIHQLPDTTITAVSSLYETAPWGYTNQPAFLNAVAQLETKLDPEPLLQQLLQIENQLGRVREVHWGPRVIDLDLLVYDNLSYTSSSLILPHPLLTQRAFVLVPLVEIAPEVMINGTTASEHLRLLGETNIAETVALWGPPPQWS